MKDPRRQPYRSRAQIVPEELVDVKFGCPKCAMKVAPEWLKKQEFPRQPVEPIDGGGFWVPSSIRMECSCSARWDQPIDQSDAVTSLALFGDEAERIVTINNVQVRFLTLNMSHITNDRFPALELGIQKLKQTIRPREEPQTWKLHFLEIWGSKHNARNTGLLGKNSKIEASEAFADLLATLRPGLFTFSHSSAMFTSAISKQEHFEIAWAEALVMSLRLGRSQKHRVSWTFDHIKDASGGASRSEGWASEVFLGLQYTNLWTWLSACATVDPPTFAQPGSHPLLEVSDFLSFWTAREFHQRAIGNKSPSITSRTGTGFHAYVLANGDVEWAWRKGFPLSKFFG
jgi:hypothetical protein